MAEPSNRFTRLSRRKPWISQLLSLAPNVLAALRVLATALLRQLPSGVVQAWPVHAINASNDAGQALTITGPGTATITANA